MDYRDAIAGKVDETPEDREADQRRRYGCGDAPAISPLRAVLEEINRTAGHVTWLGLKVAEAPSDEMLLTDYRPWVELYTRERRHLLRAATEAVKLGFMEREVQVLESQAAFVARALERVLGRLELSAEQKALAPRLLREELLAIEASGREVA